MANQGLAEKGQSPEAVLAALRQMRAQDANWRGGRTFSLVYHASDELTALLKEAYGLFFAENALSPLAFPSLRQLESEVLETAAHLFHGETAKGSLTSGGSESILLAVKTARDRARAERPRVSAPEMVLPISAHPAFEKAAHYFGVKPVHIPLRADFRADVMAAEAAIGDNTVLVVGSAPAYPHGVIDPIADLAALAAAHGIGFHTDACLGGFLLPFARTLGHPVPEFDFRIPGVTSLSADLHKYGFAAKGCSVLLHRTAELRRHQHFVYSDWPGGLYVSPSMTGTRPGGAIAAAWAVTRHLGEEGYLRLADTILRTTRRLLDGVRSIQGLEVLGEPAMSVFAFASDSLDVYALGDAMSARGWHLDRQQLPPSLHLMVTPAHEPVVEAFLKDLRECAESLAGGAPAPEGSAAMYGMLGAMPDRGAVGTFLLEFMDTLYQPDRG